MVLDVKRSMELFSDAYLRAVVSAARMHLEPRTVDVDSVDGYIHYTGWIGTDYSPQIAYQLKATGVHSQFREDHVAYPLKIKNYDELRIETGVPRILIVVVVPAAVGDWVVQDEERLRLRRCGYWMSLRGSPPTSNTTRRTVHVPRDQRVTIDALNGMMERVGRGGFP